MSLFIEPSAAPPPPPGMRLVPRASLELIVGAGGLLAIIVPEQLSAPRWAVVQYLLGALKLDVALGSRWHVWGVFHVEDWVSPAERPLKTLKLKFLE